MNIGLYISNLNGGGAQRVVSRLSDMLSKKYSIYIILNDVSRISYSYSGTVIDLKEPASSGINKIIHTTNRINKLKKVKKKYCLDIVISFLAGQNIVNVLSKTTNCKTYVSIRNFQKFKFSNEHFGQLRYAFMGKIYKNADFIIACSKLIALEIHEDFNINENKIGVLYNLYNQVELKNLANDEVDSIFINFKKSHDFLLVTSGRFNTQKGYWHLLKIVKLLKNKGLNIGLFLIGNGKQENIIINLIDKLDLSNNVMLCGFQTNPFPIEKLANAYIMTSLFEGFPNSLVEAMCIGLPILSSDCPSGPREILNPSSSLTEILQYSFKAEYGILLEPLDKKENWDVQFDEIEQNWANSIYSLIINKELEKYVQLSEERSLAFSYEKCSKTISSFITK